jgi:hypothetical protein
MCLFLRLSSVVRLLIINIFSYYKVIMEVVREDVFSLYDQMPFTIHYCDYHSCSLSGMPKFI